MIELREFKRLKTDLKIGYEFVKLNEIRLQKLKNPQFALVNDISKKGIGLNSVPDIRENILKDLTDGKLKIRLGIFLKKEDSPLIVFAKLIWINHKKEIRDDKDLRCGLIFVDLDSSTSKKINNYIKSHAE